MSRSYGPPSTKRGRILNPITSLPLPLPFLSPIPSHPLKSDSYINSAHPFTYVVRSTSSFRFILPLRPLILSHTLPLRPTLHNDHPVSPSQIDTRCFISTTLPPNTASYSSVVRSSTRALLPTHCNSSYTKWPTIPLQPRRNHPSSSPQTTVPVSADSHP
jgi:hypothetical protein